MRAVILTIAPIFVLLMAGCGDDGASAEVADAGDTSVQPDAFVDGPVALTLVGELPATSEAAQPVAGLLVNTGAHGVEVNLSVTRGGGTVAQTSVVSDGSAQVEIPWTLGVAPVGNGLHVELAEDPTQTLELAIQGTYATPRKATPFGDIAGWLDTDGNRRSTEDLAFVDDSIVLGVAPGLVEVSADGTPAWMEISGEELRNPLGVAVDRRGRLWIADLELNALMQVDTHGFVSTALTDNDEGPLVDPNYVAVGPDGKIYLSDACSGKIVRYSPIRGAIDGVHNFDHIHEGGPNGFAFDPSGHKIYVITESTGLLCGHDDVGATDELAGLYVIDADDFEAEHEAIAEGIGFVGDGLAFDVEGNLYMVIDYLEGKESTVQVLPEGSRELQPFLSDTERLYANVAFGRGDFGETTLYLTLLALAPFSPAESRGLQRLDVGIAGLPLLP